MSKHEASAAPDFMQTRHTHWLLRNKFAKRGLLGLWYLRLCRLINDEKKQLMNMLKFYTIFAILRRCDWRKPSVLRCGNLEDVGADESCD